MGRWRRWWLNTRCTTRTGRCSRCPCAIALKSRRCRRRMAARRLWRWPDTNDQLLPRTEGPWDMAGRRQTEVDGGRAQHFVLWAWPNPHPDKGVEKIAIEAAGPAFVIGGITLSDLDEEPICREGTREVIITLPQEEDAHESTALEVEVDRGVATYPYPLPGGTRPRIFSTGAKAGAKLKTRAVAPLMWK